MTAERGDILKEIRAVIVRLKEDNLPPIEITEQTSLEQLSLDSLDLLEMRFDLDRIWGLQISDEDAKRIRTIGDIIDLIVAITGKTAGD